MSYKPSNNQRPQPKSIRQERFVVSCAKAGLSVAEAVEAASFIPKEYANSMKIVSWPKFR